MRTNRVFQFLVIACILLVSTSTLNAQENNTPDPEFKGYHFENREGEKITGSVTYRDKVVFLVLETANAIGEEVILEFDEKDEDYIYKRNYIVPGKPVSFKIKKNIQKEKFVIYNPNKKRHRRFKKKAEEPNTK